jgi:hypothetical protein
VKAIPWVPKTNLRAEDLKMRGTAKGICGVREHAEASVYRRIVENPNNIIDL